MDIFKKLPFPPSPPSSPPLLVRSSRKGLSPTPSPPLSKISNSSSQLPYPLDPFGLEQLPRVHDALLAQIDALDAGDILGRRAGDAAGDDDRIDLEDDAVVDNLVNGQRN